MGKLLYEKYINHSLIKILFYIGVQPINNVVTASDVQRRDSVIHTQVSIIPQIPVPSRLSHNTAEFHVLHSRSLSLIHLKCNSVHSQKIRSNPGSGYRPQGKSALSHQVQCQPREMKGLTCRPLSSFSLIQSLPPSLPSFLDATMWSTQLFVIKVTLKFNLQPE